MKFPSLILGIAILSGILTSNSSCKKETVTVIVTDTLNVTDTIIITPTLCEMTGTYAGTSSSSLGVNSTLAYTFGDNNLVTGQVTVTGPIVTFGGYRNTCDSVFISSYYTFNNTYYLLEGKLLNGGNTINGTFTTLTTPAQTGTFNITK